MFQTHLSYSCVLVGNFYLITTTEWYVPYPGLLFYPESLPFSSQRNQALILNYRGLGPPLVPQTVKNLPAMWDLGSIPWLGRSRGEGHGNPLQYSCLENPRGQRSLARNSPRGRKESDMTEQVSTQRPGENPAASVAKETSLKYPTNYY